METEQHITFIETLIPFVGVVFLIATGVVLMTRQFRKNLYSEQLKQEALKNQYQMELLRSGILVQEQERKRIAQDMHDDLGVVLSIARMHLLQAERKYGELNEQLFTDLQNVRQLMESSIENMRRISHELMPPQLELFGVIQTMDAVCEQLNNTGKIKSAFFAEDGINVFLKDELIDLTLYRVCMELINNTIKHAEATELKLTITGSEKEVKVHYSDNGRGFSSEYIGKGIGLKNIRNRLLSLEGDILLDLKKPGFHATVYLPLRSINAEL
ncbi:histidine kinase [Fluviicola sp.]|jgi:signal transduction histidine kinase|uniref:sensor histidine kinase n=1 Tax=Fluviicola sp. TaxID=1917219 RepID=UPI00282D8D35|nr:histidine kinase [Fluviicola sp.]MDR0801708.1 histidine kinase [Fluviicola sp.]